MKRWVYGNAGLAWYDSPIARGTIRNVSGVLERLNGRGVYGGPPDHWWAMVVCDGTKERSDAYFPRRWQAKRWLEAEIERVERR